MADPIVSRTRPVSVRQRCAPRPSRRADVGLPILDSSSVSAGKVRKSRSGPRRAAVLIGVHLLILAHVVHWKVTGRTLSPVEPSEAMYTLNQGYVNAGF